MVSDSTKTESSRTTAVKSAELPKKFNYLKNKVALVRLDDYEPDHVKNALLKVFELLGLNNYFKNKAILVKPNVLAPFKLTYTPPEVIIELLKLLKQQTEKQIVVGDSTMTKALTSMTFKRSKIEETSIAEGAKIANFFESERVKVELITPKGEAEKILYLPKEVVEADVIVNLPKLKTHSGYVYTGAIKNMFGVLGNKMHMHMTHKNKAMFQKMLADIYFAAEETNVTETPKVVTIMDAVIAMEGKGPRAGDPRKVGLLIGGFNSAALDIVGYTLMNGNPNDLEAIRSLAERTGLAVDITKLELLGEPNYKEFVVKDFKKPRVSILKKGQVPESGLISKIAAKMMGLSIKINRKRCLLCEECVRHCPAEALVRKNERIEVDRDKCIECFCCGESCKANAISAKWYLFRILPLLLILLSLLAIGLGIGIWYAVLTISSLIG